MKTGKITASLAGAVAIVTLFGTSAFAESRHRDETRGDRHRDGEARVQRESDRPSEENRDNQQREPRQSRDGRAPQVVEGDHVGERGQRGEGGNYRNEDRKDRSQHRGEWDRSRGNERDRSAQRDEWNRNRDAARSRSGSNDGYRNSERSYGYGSSHRSDRNRSYGSYRNEGSRRPVYYSGRVSRYERERGGFRVWLDNGRAPFWLPQIRFSNWPLRIGLSLRLGGYYDPRGYVDVYDLGGYGGRPIYTSGELRGLVESVDYRRDSLELRDEISGEFVTVVVRGNDPRLNDLRPGDYVELSGDWSRGVFRALRLEDLRDGRDARSGGYRDDRY